MSDIEEGEVKDVELLKGDKVGLEADLEIVADEDRRINISSSCCRLGVRLTGQRSGSVYLIVR